jgi:hypothetical protein
VAGDLPGFSSGRPLDFFQFGRQLISGFKQRLDLGNCGDDVTSSSLWLPPVGLST